MRKLTLLLSMAAWMFTLPAMAAHYAYPSWNGYRLDWCKSFENGCGKPAADLFCQKKGSPQATGFAIQPHVTFETMTVGNNAVCDPRSHVCDSFAYIDCQDVGIRTFGAPKILGYRVDWCREFENNCGAPAALRYCQDNGYAYLAGFQAQPHVNFPTMTVGSHAICDPRFHGCDSFAFIRCKH